MALSSPQELSLVAMWRPSPWWVVSLASSSVGASRKTYASSCCRLPGGTGPRTRSNQLRENCAARTWMGFWITSERARLDDRSHAGAWGRSELTAARLFGKQLPNVLERLELQGIAAGVEQEHRRLFTHLALEAHIRFDHELRALRTQPFGQGFPVFPAQHHAEMRHRNVVAVHRVGVRGVLRRGFRVFVNHQLMTEKIVVDPMIAGAAFRATKNVAVEMTGSGQVINGYCQVEGSKAHGTVLLF